MINIESYMNDGANWQAQAILAALRMQSCIISDEAWNNETHSSDAEIRVGRFENCREQGYIFSLEYKYKTLHNYCVYEHRNSDDICIKRFEGQFINTPTINDLGMKDKWDYDTSFSFGCIWDATQYIIDDMLEKLKEYMEQHKKKDAE